MLPSQFPDEVRRKLTTLLALGDRDAVFDADGTLWGGDASEALLQWAEREGHIRAPDGAASVMDHYNGLLERDRIAGFIWAAQQYAGNPIDTLAKWAEAAFLESVAETMFPEMAGLVKAFHEHGWQVWIVTASPRVAVEPGARRLGIPMKNVLALDFEVVDGVATDRVREPVSGGAGKVTCIDLMIGRRPSFAAGNSVDDLPMLRHARETAMIVNPTGVHDHTVDLADTAKHNGWLLHYP